MIKELLSIAQYKKLLEDFRTVCKTPFSNIYLMPKDINRFINLKRISYVKNDYGIIFYLDEETFYRVCLYVDEQQLFEIPARDKKLLIRNVYRADNKGIKLSYVEARLQALGFLKVGTTVQIEGKPQELLFNCKSMEQYKKKMERRGYYCKIPDFSRICEIETLILESEVIKDYHMTFRTHEEKRNLEKGSYMCIVNNSNEICAAIITDLNPDTAQIEAIAVKKEYKIRGLAPILNYQIFKQLCEKQIKIIKGWVETDNNESIKYHLSLGYHFSNKHAEEWILDNKTDKLCK